MLQRSSSSKRSIAVLLGSVRRDRMGARAARLVVEELERRGHDVHLVDPLELQLPLLDRMYKEHPAGEAPENLEASQSFIAASTGSWSSVPNIITAFPRLSKTCSIISSRSIFGGLRESSATRRAVLAAFEQQCSFA